LSDFLGSSPSEVDEDPDGLNTAISYVVLGVPFMVTVASFPRPTRTVLPDWEESSFRGCVDLSGVVVDVAGFAVEDGAIATIPAVVAAVDAGRLAVTGSVAVSDLDSAILLETTVVGAVELGAVREGETDACAREILEEGSSKFKSTGDSVDSLSLSNICGMAEMKRIQPMTVAMILAVRPHCEYFQTK
jgi:hypothetical protein